MKKLYSVYDKKAQVYGPIMEFDGDVMAVRNFQQAVLNNDSLLSRYPEDFRLEYIGDFDNQFGALYYQQSRIIVDASAFIEKK